MSVASWLLTLLAWNVVSAQEFGQNQVIRRDFDWKVRSSPHFDLYYYDEGAGLVVEAAGILEASFERLTRELRILPNGPSWLPERLKKKRKWRRRPFFLYASPNDFQQSAIAEAGDGTGGITEPFKDRFMVYNDGSRQWLCEVSAHELVHILQFEVLMSGFWKTGKILKSFLYPLWMMEGMPGFLTRDIESALEETVIRDAATSGGLIPLTHLEHFGHLKPHQIVLAYREGAQAMEFLAEQYGSRKPGDMLRIFESRFETSQVLQELVGLNARKFSAKFLEYVENKYKRVARAQGLREPETFGSPLTASKGRIPEFNSGPALSPDLKTAYYATTADGHPPEIRALDLGTGRSRKILGYRPSRIENLPLGRFANISRVLAVSPNGRRLAFSATKNHRDALYIYDIASKRLERRELPGFSALNQPAFSPDSKFLAFSAMENAGTDLYLYELASGRLRRLTDDSEDDDMPAFTPDGAALIYSKEIGPGRRLYRLSLADSRQTRLENSGGEARDPVVSPDGKRALFILEGSDSSEIAELDLETGKVSRLTKSLGACYTPSYAGRGEIVFAALRRGSVHLYKGPRSKFLDEAVPQELAGDAFEPARSSAALSGERPYQFSYSTDLFIPALFYSSEGGLFMAGYWQGSDLLGRHQNQALFNYHSAKSYSYQTSYLYRRWRPQLFAGVTGFSQEDLIDADLHRVDDVAHSQFAGVRYPFDRFHRVDAFLQSASEQVVDRADRTQEDRQARLYGLSLTRDTVRGRYLVPNQGSRLEFSYSRAVAAAGGNRSYYVAGAEGHKFVATGSQSALSFRAAAARALGPDRPQLLLGGLGGVRGYARASKRDLGGHLGLLNAEWRFPLIRDLNYYMWYIFPDFYFKAVFGTIFADAGYAWDSEGQLSRSRWRDLRQSVGLGIRIHTFILQQFPFVISMDYARRTTQNGGIFYVYLGQVF
ncbi:MAG: PD40 domain-containing protein [Elusimicrobia bacterium]|nr:PD40 domain-containing protein [Elusimicrobiota bacterium]